MTLFVSFVMVLFLQQPIPVSFRVLDPQGAIVSSARVTMYRLGSASLINGEAGPDGLYHGVLPSPGTFVVDVETSGFRKISRIVTARADQPVQEDISLEIAGVDSSVIVTASAGAQTMDQVAKAVSVVGAEEILHRGETTLSGIVGAAPGVFVRGGGSPGQLVQIRIRGLRPDAVAVLFDGMRFRDASTTQGDSSPFTSNLNFIAADRVEILRGSGSSLYGTNAAGGVLNIVSDQGGGSTHGSMQAEGGSMGFLRGRTQIGGGALNDRLRYSAGILHLNLMRGLDENDRARSTGGQGFLAYAPAPRTTVSARFMGSDDFVQSNLVPTAAGIPSANLPPSGVVPALAFDNFLPAADDSDNRRASRHHATAVRLQQILSSQVNVRASYQYVWASRAYINGPAGPGFQPLVTNDGRYVGEIHTFDAMSDMQFSPANRFTFGYEFEREHYFDRQDNNLSGPQRVRTQTSIHQNGNAFYFQNQLGMVDGQLQMSVSGRAQFFGLGRPAFQASGAPSAYDQRQFSAPPKALTGDVSLSYFVSSTGTKIRGHAGNAYRAASLYERFGGGFSANPTTGQLSFTAYGNPYLSPDRYNSVDAGLDQYLLTNRVRLAATYFYTRVVTITAFDFGSSIKPATDLFGRSIGYINGSGGLSRGVELAAESRPIRNLTLNAAYTYTRAHLDRDITVPGFWRVLGVPRHIVTLVATQTIGRGSLTLDVSGNSELFASFTAAGRPRAYAFPGYVKADVSGMIALAQTEANRLNLTAKVENILNRKYYEVGWLAPGATFVAGLSYRF